MTDLSKFLAKELQFLKAKQVQKEAKGFTDAALLARLEVIAEQVVGLKAEGRSNPLLSEILMVLYHEAAQRGLRPPVKFETK